MKHQPGVEARPLGTPRSPRRKFVAPPAVRLAQLSLLARITAITALVLGAGLNLPATPLALPGSRSVVLPGGALWNALAAWVLVGSGCEVALVLRLGGIRTGSRRVVLMVEAAVIAGTGVYAAAGFKVAVIPLTLAIAAVVLLRLDHVRHAFARARNERRLVGRPVATQLYSGYAFDVAPPSQRSQHIGYRVGIDCPLPPPETRSR